MERRLNVLRWTLIYYLLAQFNCVDLIPLMRTGLFSDKDVQNVIITKYKESMDPANIYAVKQDSQLIGDLATTLTQMNRISERLATAKEPSKEKELSYTNTTLFSISNDDFQDSESTVKFEQPMTLAEISTEEELNYSDTAVPSTTIDDFQDISESGAESERPSNTAKQYTKEEVSYADTTFSSAAIDDFQDFSISTVKHEQPVTFAELPTEEKVNYINTTFSLATIDDFQAFSETTIKPEQATSVTVSSIEEEVNYSGTTFSSIAIDGFQYITETTVKSERLTTATVPSTPIVTTSSFVEKLSETDSATDTPSYLDFVEVNSTAIPVIVSSLNDHSTHTNSEVSVQDNDTSVTSLGTSLNPELPDANNSSYLNAAETTSLTFSSTDLVSTEAPMLQTSIASNSTADGISICSVCKSCTNDYIDRVLSDVTTNLPPFLELPDRQGRFQLYHGKLFGLATLERANTVAVTCSYNDTYSVMVPLRVKNAKAFYKWQIEMPLRTFYGDINVTAANAESRIFYSHSDGGSTVEGLKITALDNIQTEFSGLGPFNGMVAGLTRAAIHIFRRSFARVLENALMEAINKELQDVKKYEEYYEIKE